MAKYQITRACGHTESVQIAGKTSDRDRQVAHEESRLCYACYQAQKAAERAAESAKAAAEAATSGFLALTGTEKQIAWAETIRKAHHDSLTAAAANAITPAIKDLFDEEIQRYMAETSAHAWIERRNETRDARWLASQLQARMMTEPKVADAISVAAVAARIKRSQA